MTSKFSRSGGRVAVALRRGKLGQTALTAAAWAGAAAALNWPAAASAAPTFHGLGQVAVLGTPLAQQISADGTTIVGRMLAPVGSPLNEGAFRYRIGIGMETFSSAFDEPTTYAPSVSANGNAIAGYTSGGANNRAFLWQLGTSPNEILPAAGDSGAIATAINGIGDVVAGASFEAGRGFRTFRWTSAGGNPEDLGAPVGASGSYPFGMSGDGNVIFGQAHYPALSGQAFRWTQAGGMEVLPNPGAVTGGFGAASSADGSVIVGHGYSPTGEVAVVWHADGTSEALDRPAGAITAGADAVDAAGGKIVGSATRLTLGGIESFAMLWISAQGTHDIGEYLTAQGVDLTGWKLEAARGISADGLTIVGTGRHNGVPESWVVVIPSPGALLMLLGAGLFGTARRRRDTSVVLTP